MKRPFPFVISIAAVSGGGKTTITSYLKGQLTTCLLRNKSTRLLPIKAIAEDQGCQIDGLFLLGEALEQLQTIIFIDMRITNRLYLNSGNICAFCEKC